jgi:hypothetical protein
MGPDPASRRVLRRLLFATFLCAVVGNVPLVGLPGAIFLELGSLLWKATGRPDPVTAQGAGVWGTAILITAVWPLAFVPAYLLARRLTRAGGPLLRWGVFAAVVLAWGFLLGVVFLLG